MQEADAYLFSLAIVPMDAGVRTGIGPVITRYCLCWNQCRQYGSCSDFRCNLRRPGKALDHPKRLGLIDFALLQHVDSSRHMESSMDTVAIGAAEKPVPTYGIDDQTAIKVKDCVIEVISEGNWKLFAPET